MTDAISMIESAMRADAEAMRVYGQNVANAEVTAYRRQIPLTSVSFDQLLATGAHPEITPEPASTVAIDRRQGTLKGTGEPLHIALEGNGYFVLQAPQGSQYTRRGDFAVSAAGVLTSGSGMPVLGTNGEIVIGTGTPVIESDGTVRVGNDVVGQIAVVQIANEETLQYLGDGVYAGADITATESDAVVRQHYLETSNVTPVGEMVQMMETIRHFEAAQRFVRGYDEMLEKAISELGKVG